MLAQDKKKLSSEGVENLVSVISVSLLTQKHSKEYTIIYKIIFSCEGEKPFWALLQSYMTSPSLL